MNNHKLAKLTISLASISLIAGGLLYSKPKTPLPHAFITYSAPPIDGKNLRLAVKDLIDVKGQITTAGSHYLLETRAPAVKDAKCLQFARKPGVTIVGKTNLSEFAVGVTGSNDYFGTPVNPIMPDRVPGGSSSGSAVAVALGLADVALGTDTAGSIRVPAACCGVAGLKTTFGLVPIDGVYPVSPDHLDTVGPIAKDVSRLVKGMALLQEGFEDLYDEAKLARPDAKTIRIGRLNVPKTDPVIDIAIDALLIQKGFQIVQLDEDFTEAWGQAQRDGNIVAASGAWSTNEHLHRRLRVSARAKEALLVGEVAHGKALKKALARKAAWQAELGRVFESVDAIALPVLRTTPPEIHRVELHAEVEAHMLLIQNTAAVNFAGNPALAIPVPLAGSDFPMTSIQFVGPHGSEASLLNIGRLAESLK